MQVETISKRQLALIGASFVINPTLAGVFVQLIQKGKTDAWLVVPLVSMLTFLVLAMLAATARRFPDRDLFQAMVLRHPFAGRAVGLLYIAYLFILLCRDFRFLVLFVNLTLLEFTPLFVIALLILFCTVYMARSGVEVVARVTEGWMILLILCILLLPVLVASEFNLENLQPFLYDGMSPILHGSWYLIPYLGEIAILPFIISYPAFNLKSGTSGLLAGAGAILILLLCTLLVLSANVASRIHFPVYEMVRQIHLTDFLDRLELPLVAVWIPTLLAKIAMEVYLAGHGLKRLFPALSAREMMLPLGTLTLVCSFWLFRDMTELLLFNRPWPFLACCFQIGIPLLLFLFLRPGRRRDKGELRDEQPA